MKPTSAFVFAVVLAVSAPTGLFAQQYAVDRGSWLVGGTAGLSRSSFEGSDYHSTAAFLEPQAQYFVVRGLALGGQAQISRVGNGSVYAVGVGAGPAVTYYFGQGRRAVYPYVGGSFLFTHSSVTGSSNSPPDVSQRWYEPYAGAALMLARNVGVDTRAYFRKRYDSRQGSAAATDYGVAVGISAFVF